MKNGKVYLQLQLHYTTYYNNVEAAIADAYYIGSVLCLKTFKDVDPSAKADEIYEFMLGVFLYEKIATITGPYNSFVLK